MANLLDRVADALSKREQMDNLWRSLSSMKDKSYGSVAELSRYDITRLVDARRKTVRSLKQLIDRLRYSVESNGGRFFLAREGKEAAEYVAELASSRGVKLIVKSKSMTSEEIDLNRALQERGIEVVETDLGERIVQLAGQRPSHMLAPAIHLNRRQIAELISDREGIQVDHEPEAITRVMRTILREKFLRADMGITGANVIVAESGAVIIVTNEGNGRFVTSIPKILVVVAGVEKLVESWEDAMAILRVLPRSATGKRSTVYISIYGAGWRGVKGGEESEFHVVLIDNGRIEASDSEWLSETLLCIRCSSCYNVCPTYRLVGGHVFGDVYNGPIGVLWTAITKGVEKAAEIAPLCISCSLCRDACPVSIDIPMSISWVKSSARKHNRIDKVISNYEVYLKLGCRFPSIFNWINNNGLARKVLEKVAGIDARRPLPSFVGGSVFDKYGNRGVSSARRDIKVAYFVDSYASYVDWRIAGAVIELCEYLDVEIVVPKRQASSGMPYIQYGLLDKARKVAEKNVEILYEYVNDGYYVVCSEPTAAYCLREVYPKLFNDKRAKCLAEKTYELIDFLSRKWLLNGKVKRVNRGSIFYHYPCHSRSVSPGMPSAKILGMVGYNVYTYDYGCCGMAGTWGMRSGLEGYELSVEIGRRVCDIIRSTHTDRVSTESSVCIMQLRHVGGLEVKHTIEVLLEALDKG